MQATQDKQQKMGTARLHLGLTQGGDKMRTQQQHEQNSISKKEFFDIFGLTPQGASQQTGIPLAELGKIIGQIAKRMHISPRSVLNQVRYFRISESFLMNIAVKYSRHNRETRQREPKIPRNKMV